MVPNLSFELNMQNTFENSETATEKCDVLCKQNLRGFQVSDCFESKDFQRWAWAGLRAGCSVVSASLGFKQNIGDLL